MRISYPFHQLPQGVAGLFLPQHPDVLHHPQHRSVPLSLPILQGYHNPLSLLQPRILTAAAPAPGLCPSSPPWTSWFTCMVIPLQISIILIPLFPHSALPRTLPFPVCPSTHSTDRQDTSGAYRLHSKPTDTPLSCACHGGLCTRPQHVCTDPFIGSQHVMHE